MSVRNQVDENYHNGLQDIISNEFSDLPSNPLYYNSIKYSELGKELYLMILTPNELTIPIWSPHAEDRGEDDEFIFTFTEDKFRAFSKLSKDVFLKAIKKKKYDLPLCVYKPILKPDTLIATGEMLNNQFDTSFFVEEDVFILSPVNLWLVETGFVSIRHNAVGDQEELTASFDVRWVVDKQF